MEIEIKRKEGDITLCLDEENLTKEQIYYLKLKYKDEKVIRKEKIKRLNEFTNTKETK